MSKNLDMDIKTCGLKVTVTKQIKTDEEISQNHPAKLSQKYGKNGKKIHRKTWQKATTNTLNTIKNIDIVIDQVNIVIIIRLTLNPGSTHVYTRILQIRRIL